jgi:hypothetical protein
LKVASQICLINYSHKVVSKSCFTWAWWKFRIRFHPKLFSTLFYEIISACFKKHYFLNTPLNLSI